MTEDSATVGNINKKALGEKTEAVNNVEENCRGLMQKFQLTTLDSWGIYTPNHRRRVITWK